MKLIVILSLILICNLGFAQDPQLIENTWYLQNVIIDGQSNIPPPPNDEVPFVYINFSTDSFSTAGCDQLSGEVEYGTSGATFFFPDVIDQTFLDCENEENNLFDDIYFSFFYDSQTEIFTYEITTETNGSKTLVIISASGDEAIYSSELLSSYDFANSSFVIYPNPVKDELFISTISNFSDFAVTIFDIDGKRVLSLNVTNFNTKAIDVQKLTSGIYFILLKDNQGRTAMKKLIKS